MTHHRMWTSALLLAGGMLGVSGTSALAQAQELRIGFIAPKTGIFSQLGIDMQNGFQMYLDEHNGMLGGAKVNLIVEDDQGRPDTGVTKANKLILSDKVHMLVGGVLATTGYALAPVATREKMLYIGSIATADDLAQRDFDKYPYMVRPTSGAVAARASARAMGLRAGLQADRPSPPTTRSATRRPAASRRRSRIAAGRSCRKSGRRSAPRISGPTSRRIKSDIDAIFSLMVGPMALQFPKQLRASGNKKPIIGGGTNYDEFVLPSMGDEVIGDVSAFMYCAALDTPKNEAFVKKYRAKYGKVPSYYSEANYTTAQWIDETMKKPGGKYPGPVEFIKTMRGIKVDAVRGPVPLDDSADPINNIYIKKVEKKKMFGYDKDELWNTVIKTYPNVSQFWTYNKDAFLKQPVYSRDFPPCKYLQLGSVGLRLAGEAASAERCRPRVRVSLPVATRLAVALGHPLRKR